MQFHVRSAVLCGYLLSSTASALRTQVVSSFVFTRYGDRTPLYSSDRSVLTPYGARQMHDAGTKFRDRYLTTTFNEALDSPAIRDISHYQYNSGEINILTSDYQYMIASAQAFMQGLYPPLADASNYNYTQILGVSELANGTNVVAPLNGYQYPDINVASSYDIKSVWLDGAQNCPAFATSLINYYQSADFDFLYRSSLDFYNDIGEDFLESTFTPNEYGYFDSYWIYDWMQYQYLHNTSFFNTISNVNMTRAEILAANWVDAMYGNASDPVQSMGGRSLATQILSSFYSAIQSEGEVNKLNLWFGDFAPMVGFASLAGLTSQQNEIFYNIPPFGSSFIFELVALLPENELSTAFPNSSDLYVRFLFQNGTDEYSDAIEYPMFGRSPSALISWLEFVNGLNDFSLSGIKEWCLTCGSYSIFCPAYTGVDNSPLAHDGKRGKLSPAIAGVVGALVSLAVAAILLGLLMAFAGLRFHRQGKKASDLGGFKGSQKLASDQDLTLPKGGAGATVVTTEPDGPRGHERVGSWELGEAAKKKEAGDIGAVLAAPRRPSYEDDEIHINPYGQAVKPRDQV